MFNPEKKIGASLLVMGLMLNVNEAFAQTTPTCVKAPTCEELGYDKVASDCGELAKLRCPFDPDKYFCTAYTDLEGNMPIAVGDVVYSDGTYGSPAIKQPNKIPIGVVFSTTGNKFVALETYGSFWEGKSISCSGYEAGGFTNWSSPTQTELKTMFNNKSTINATLASLASTALGGGYAYDTDDYYVYYVKMEGGGASKDDRSSYPTRCVNSIGNITSEKPAESYKVGDTYIKDGEPVGTVIEVDGTGKHGIILNRASRLGTLEQAIEYCDGLNASNGLTWGLPSWDQMVVACDKNISGYSSQGKYITGSNRIQYDHFGCRESTNINADTTYSYFCAAAF